MAEPAEQWLRSRLARGASRAVEAFLAEAAAHIATATSDAVSIRALSGDGALVPVAAHHPDPDRGQAMLEIMSATTSARDGLWRRVVEEQQAVRWYLPVGTSTSDASADQTSFIGQHAVRAVLGIPLVRQGELLGGLALVRFTVDRPFVDGDEELLHAAADDITTAMVLRRGLQQSGRVRPTTESSYRTRFDAHRKPPVAADPAGDRHGLVDLAVDPGGAVRAGRSALGPGVGPRRPTRALRTQDDPAQRPRPRHDTVGG